MTFEDLMQLLSKKIPNVAFEEATDKKCIFQFNHKGRVYQVKMEKRGYTDLRIMDMAARAAHDYKTDRYDSYYVCFSTQDLSRSQGLALLELWDIYISRWATLQVQKIMK